MCQHSFCNIVHRRILRDLGATTPTMTSGLYLQCTEYGILRTNQILFVNKHTYRPTYAIHHIEWSEATRSHVPGLADDSCEGAFSHLCAFYEYNLFE